MELKFIQVKYRNEISVMRLSNLAIPLVEEYYKEIVPKKTLDSMLFFLQEKTISKEIKQKRTHYYIISFEDRYIGFSEMKRKEDSLWISKIFLKPEHRYKGHGKKLIELIKELAIEQNLKKIRIGIPNEKEETIQAFKKFGFYPTKEIARYMGDGYFVYEFIYFYDIENK